jgi:hypothetical protein
MGEIGFRGADRWAASQAETKDAREGGAQLECERSTGKRGGEICPGADCRAFCRGAEESTDGSGRQSRTAFGGADAAVVEPVLERGDFEIWPDEAAECGKLLPSMEVLCLRRSGVDVRSASVAAIAWRRADSDRRNAGTHRRLRDRQSQQRRPS